MFEVLCLRYLLDIFTALWGIIFTVYLLYFLFISIFFNVHTVWSLYSAGSHLCLSWLRIVLWCMLPLQSWILRELCRVYIFCIFPASCILYVPCTNSAHSQSPLLLATVFFGANDATLPPKECESRGANFTVSQAVPLDRFGSNLREIVRYLSEDPLGARLEAKRVLMITPPKVDDAAWLKTMKARY
jgi:hypothetical protein